MKLSSRLKHVKELHDIVIHKAPLTTSLRTTYAEERQIKILNDKDLELVCRECFRDRK
jgi:hypothetical protein